MGQIDYIKEIAKYGLENDQKNLMDSLQKIISYYKDSKRINMAMQLQSLVKHAKRESGQLTRVGTNHYFNQQTQREIDELVIDKLRSEYRLKDLVIDEDIKRELSHFIRENSSVDFLQQFNLTISNKLLLHGPSGCGKTLASYVIAGELNKPMYIINLGAIVSSKLGETSKNLMKIFRKATQESCIIFIDEFDSIGKVRDYNQDHGEMKRVVNTILQLFDYLPPTSVIIAATNQQKMIDEALVRRFDLNLRFELPDTLKIGELINLTLKNGQFRLPKDVDLSNIIEMCSGLSYYSIQKTLINAIKRTLFNQIDNKNIAKVVNTNIWLDLIQQEKRTLQKS
ncbi:ATP-binding protein [Maribacter sp. PR1]|uniref:ATP-binding protein n=1 Tax=Maribacter cobaltidurans TaxID=1178778 RepID=A0ABU7IQQ4_9FLAO|nr:MULTISPECIES: ATP-binding protein [Maribacter]MDC6387905.1 ATP-binding protein [Maribacter sp. PR1]MEE1975294.1 ATP-binding protein [Maribacter cobaltidurans]